MRYGSRKTAVVGDRLVRRDRELDVALLERERGAGEQGGRANGLAAARRQLVELLRGLGHVAAADVLVNLGELLDLLAATAAPGAAATR